MLPDAESRVLHRDYMKQTWKSLEAQKIKHTAIVLPLQESIRPPQLTI